MKASQRDLDYLNQQALLLAVYEASESYEQRSLAFSDDVARLLINASPGACRQATECNVPLVIFRRGAIERLTHATTRLEPVSELMGRVNALALGLARQVLLSHPVIGALWFGLAISEARMLTDLSIFELNHAARCHGRVLYLRDRSSAKRWDRYLIARRLPVQRGRSICNDQAVLSMVSGG